MRKIDQNTLRELEQAIESDSPEKLASLIETGISLNQKIGELRKTLLEVAVENNSIQVVRMLIDAGADLDKGADKPLILAALGNAAEILRLLLAAGANPNVTNSNPDEGQRGLTALMYAVDLPEKIGIVEQLLKDGADPQLATNKGNTALGDAVDFGNVLAVRMLLEAGCRPRGPVLFPPIYRAELELFGILLSAGADVQALGTSDTHFIGCTPLEAAVGSRAGKLDLIRDLQKRKLDANETATLERWQDEAAVYFQMTRALIPATAAVDPALLLSPLFHAAAAGDVEAVKLLLATGVDPNRAIGRLAFERTALNVATAGGHAETAEALIAAGAKQ